MTPTEKSAVRKSCDLESMRFRALAEKMSKIVMRWAVMKEHQEIASIIGELLECLFARPGRMRLRGVRSQAHGVQNFSDHVSVQNPRDPAHLGLAARTHEHVD